MATNREMKLITIRIVFTEIADNSFHSVYCVIELKHFHYLQIHEEKPIFFRIKIIELSELGKSCNDSKNKCFLCIDVQLKRSNILLNIRNELEF